MIEKVINPQTLLFKDAQTLINEGWNSVVTDQPITMSTLIVFVELGLTEVSIYKGDTL